MKSIYCLIAFGFLASGCGGSDEPELGVVTGEVIQAGSPVPGALVEFFPEAGVTSTAITDSEGKYSLRYNDREGAIVGTHQVQVTPGASADIVIVDGDPLGRIADTQNVVGVVRNGRFYSAIGLLERVQSSANVE